jgi:ribonuclease HII
MKITSNEYEIIYWPQNKFVLGMDEAGRGPICGPLVVCGVILPLDYKNDMIYDSKAVSEKNREILFEIIKKDAIAYQIEIIDEKIIDELNIYQAVKKYMQKIANDLECDVVLTDAMKLDSECIPIIKGDQKSINIAAASILAKVTRDHIMYEYDKQYPDYGFKNHKGYPTKKHIEAVNKFGILDFYRKTYNPIKRMLAENRNLKLPL